MSVMTRNDVPLPLHRGTREHIITPERKIWLRNVAAGGGQIFLGGFVIFAVVAAVIGLKAFAFLSRMSLTF